MSTTVVGSAFSSGPTTNLHIQGIPSEDIGNGGGSTQTHHYSGLVGGLTNITKEEKVIIKETELEEKR